MEKKYIEIENGEKLAYIEQGSGHDTLILIHGNFSSSLHYSPLFERLPKDFHVLAPDLRGFGDSSYKTRIKTMKDFADDIKSFMDVKGLKSANIAGWSLGGGVALEFAAAYPDMIKKLILINSASHKGYPVFKKDEKGQMKIGEIYQSPEELGTDPVQVIPLLMAQKNNDINTMSYVYGLTVYTVNKPNESDMKLWMTEALKQKNLIDADWALANFNMSNQHNFYNNGTNNIHDVKCPILHTWGKKDITVPEYMVLENLKALEKQSKHIVYENCGHSPLTDVPDQLTKDILEFIRS